MLKHQQLYDQQIQQQQSQLISSTSEKHIFIKNRIMELEREHQVIKTHFSLKLLFLL